MVKALLFLVGFLYVAGLDAAVIGSVQTLEAVLPEVSVELLPETVPEASVLPAEIQSIDDLIRPLPIELESEAACAEEPNSQIEVVELPEVEIAVPEVEVIAPEAEAEAEAEIGACVDSEIIPGDLTRPLPVPEVEVEVAVPEIEVIQPEVAVPEVEVIQPEVEVAVPEVEVIEVEVAVPEVEVIEAESGLVRPLPAEVPAETESEVAVAVPEVVLLPAITV